jgi:hypothetical protein
MPPHERDFPRRELREPVPGNGGSGMLALLVGSYLFALLAAILLLGSIGEAVPI